MEKPTTFDPEVHCAGLDREFRIKLTQANVEPPESVVGATFGVAKMASSAPHAGECHHDGDETLYLISGRVRVVFTDDPIDDVLMGPGDGAVVPQGLWHRVDVLEPCEIVYLTPGPNNEVREL